jgi:hypothetical protein
MGNRKALSVAVAAERPEAELLLWCARSRRDPEGSATIRALLQEGINWEYLLRTAYRHGVTPLLFWQLNAAAPEAIPENISNRLRIYFRNNNLRNLSLARELLGLLSNFEAHSIQAIPYKGPTLAALAYENLALREFDDLDILVRRQEVLRARELLASKGYRPEYRLTRAQEAAFTRYGDQYRYTRDDGGIVVELHWELASRAFSSLLSTEQPWWRLEPISLGGGTVPTFSPEDLLVILCVHGSMHLWDRLGWVYDVAELVRVRREIDWERLMEQATALGCRRALFLGLLLAENLLGTSFPQEISQRLQADTVAKTLAREVGERLFQEDGGSQGFLEESLFRRFHLEVMERLIDKVRYCVRQVTSPSLEDVEHLPLPAYLFPAYRFLRPARLTGKHAQRLLSVLNGPSQ